MTVPTNIRINLNAPFPSLVTGSGAITVTKVNGIWTLGYSVVPFPTQIPPPANLATDYVLVYDSIAQTYVKVPLSAFVGVTLPPAQRAVTNTPIVISPSDVQLNCNIPAPATCALPAAATRGGARLTFKDLGQAAGNNIVITPNGAETIDGVNAPVVIRTNFAALTLVPFNDTVNSGWGIT